MEDEIETAPCSLPYGKASPTTDGVSNNKVPISFHIIYILLVYVELVVSFSIFAAEPNSYSNRFFSVSGITIL